MHCVRSDNQCAELHVDVCNANPQQHQQAIANLVCHRTMSYYNFTMAQCQFRVLEQLAIVAMYQS
eukprot:8743-Heterococcus_DN1.PRE.2